MFCFYVYADALGASASVSACGQLPRTASLADDLFGSRPRQASETDIASERGLGLDPGSVQ